METTRPRSMSNTSNKELSADNIQILVNINPDKTIKLNVRPSHTVTNVLNFLEIAASTTLPADARLLLDDRVLEPSTTVNDLSLTKSSILKIDPPTSQQLPSINPAATVAKAADSKVTRTPKKSNKPRCSKEGCKTFAQPIVGDCGFCQQRFCGKHRMLESHNCAGLEDARQADKDRNAAKLEGERTVMLRGL